MSTHKIPLSELPQNGHSKKYKLDDTDVLIACIDEQYYAVAPTCTHWGGPLEKGMICGHTVMCPWHHACFDLRNGKMLEPPALDALKTYAVQFENDELSIDLTPQKSSMPDGINKQDLNIVIVGGGAAGQAAAEELRHLGFDGRITIISESSSVAVDRPNLSKDYLAGNADPAWIPLRSNKWYDKNGVEIRLSTTVSEIDTEQNRLILTNGETLNYYKVLLATGAEPRRLDVEGSDLKGVFTLREWKDADALLDAAKEAKNAVVIGSSFIGMEAAASLAGGHDLKVTVVSRDLVPFQKSLGEEIGRLLLREHQEHGIDFRAEQEVEKFEGEDGKLVAVHLKNGERIPADFALMGIGVEPRTAFLKESGIKLSDKGAVLTDVYLQSNHPDVFAAGDIARWEDGNGKSQRIEHWRVALQQGKIAARNMLDKKEKVTQHVPFFWSTQWDVKLGYVGHAGKWDEIIYAKGHPSEGEFVAYYIKDGKLAAAASVGQSATLHALEFLMLEGKTPEVGQLKQEDFDLAEQLKQ